MYRSGVALVVLLVGLAAGCTPSGGPAAAPAHSTAASGPAASGAAPTAEPTAAPPVKLRAAYTSVSGLMAPIWMAQDGGYFAREGLDVDLSSFPSGAQGITALMAGEVDFLQIAGATTTSAALGGGDTVVLATTVRKLVTSLVVRPEIQQAEDLRGKAVGITRLGTTSETGMRQALRHFGLDPDRDVAIVQHGEQTALLGGLEAGRVMAANLSYPAVTRARKSGHRELLDIGTLGIPYASTGVSTRRSFAAERPDVVRRYLRALLAGIHRLHEDKAFALEVFRSHLRTDDPEVLEDTYTAQSSKYIERVPYPDEVSLQGVLDELANENPRAREAHPRDFYDDRFLRELDESGYIRSLSGR